MAFETLTPLISYPSDGVITQFDIPDKFYDASDVKVFYVDGNGQESQFDFGTDYSVVITATDPTPPSRKSGRVSFVTPPVDAGSVVVFIWPDSDQDQPFEGQPVTPRQNERVHDRHSMRDAALRELLFRGFRAPLNAAPALRYIEVGAPGRVPMYAEDGSGSLVEGPTVGEVALVAGIVDEIVTVAGISTQVVAVAAISTEVVGVYAIRNQIATLAPIAGAIAILAPLDDELIALAPVAAEIAALGPIAAQIFTVAGIAANVVTVSGIAANVTAVAGNAANITAVANNAANINAVVANAANINAVAANETNIDIVAANTANINAAVADIPNLAAKLNIEGSQLFTKADPFAVAFTKTGVGTASLKAGTRLEVSGSFFVFAAATAIAMPALVAGTDYAIWAKPDGTLQATTDFSVGPLPFSRKIGGFHYSPGGNAAAQAGGNTTPQINEFSFWDLKFRPACADPRGMVLVAGSFWCDIYLTGVDHHINGTSRYNVVIADGASPPKIPLSFGGNGSATYSSLTWWEAAEVLQSHGKELLNYDEFAAAMYGTTEATSGTTDPVSTILRAPFTSRWGVMLATGNLWVWAREFGGPYGTAAYTANTNGRGSTYNLSNAALLGGGWGSLADSGSRASSWDSAPSLSGSSIGARGRSDLVCHA